MWETPTKREAGSGLVYVREAAMMAEGGFAVSPSGGIDLDNVSEVTSAGASRIVVVRAIRDAPDPRGRSGAAAALGDGEELT